MTALRRWSTDDVSPARRLDYWTGAICDGLLEMKVSCAAPSAFGASLESSVCGPLVINRVKASATDVRRTRDIISRSSRHFYYLIAVIDSGWTVAHDGRDSAMKAGDAVLVDSSRSYGFHFPQSCETASIQLTPEWVSFWLGNPDSAVGRPVDGRFGWGAALSACMSQLSPGNAENLPLSADWVSEQIGGLLALACVHSDRPHSVDAPARKILEFIKAHFEQPGLTACFVAMHLGISERTLHRRLAESQTTFLHALMQCRMSAARRMLVSPRFDQMSVAEIGRRCGWSDASHFARLCRQYLGRTPSQFRSQR